MTPPLPPTIQAIKERAEVEELWKRFRNTPARREDTKDIERLFEILAAKWKEADVFRAVLTNLINKSLYRDHVREKFFNVCINDKQLASRLSVEYEQAYDAAQQALNPTGGESGEP